MVIGFSAQVSDIHEESSEEDSGWQAEEDICEADDDNRRESIDEAIASGAEDHEHDRGVCGEQTGEQTRMSNRTRK
jgi:hypothetical protein